jgi:hypothetical protein
MIDRHVGMMAMTNAWKSFEKTAAEGMSGGRLFLMWECDRKVSYRYDKIKISDVVI